jgi:hypothetical protein
MESFYKSTKMEEVCRQKYQTHEQAARGVADYIERLYNQTLLQSSLVYFSQVEYEK